MAGIRMVSGKPQHQFLYIQGRIRTDGTASFYPFEVLTSTEDISSPTSKGSLTIVLEDSKGESIAAHSFEPAEVVHALDDEAKPFGMIIPYEIPAARIVLMQADKTLTERIVNPTPPTVKLTLTPKKDETVTGERTIAWEASAAGGEPLTFSIWYSPDQGETWLPVRVSLSESSTQIDFDKLAGSDAALIRVLASDGVNTAEARSTEPFRVPLKPPEVTINAPQDGEIFSPGEHFLAEGSAFDWKDGPIAEHSSYSWTSNKDGFLGIGRWTTLKLLSFGEHTITLTAQNADGAEGQGSTHIIIRTPSYAPMLHRSILESTDANSTPLDHAVANKNPYAILFITSTWSPSGTGVYNNHPTGVWYDIKLDQWAIFNQDQKALPKGAAFNVDTLTASESVWVHRTDIGNIVGNSTYLDHPLTNGNPNALLFVTSNWNPGGNLGIYNAHVTGVWYDSTVGKWAVFHQDRAAMAQGLFFNIEILAAGDTVAVHQATQETISGNSTYLDHPLINANPDAIVFITANWNPGGSGGVYNNSSIGVWYDENAKKWAIFNQDLSSMPNGAAFNFAIRGA